MSYKVLYFSKQTMTGFGLEFQNEDSAQESATYWCQMDTNNRVAVVKDEIGAKKKK